MSHSIQPRRQINRSAKQTNNQPDNTPFISDAVRSWIKNVIAPALVKAYLAEQALRNGEVRG